MHLINWLKKLEFPSFTDIILYNRKMTKEILCKVQEFSEKLLPNISDIVNLINSGRTPFLDEFHYKPNNYHLYHIVIPPSGSTSLSFSDELVPSECWSCRNEDGKFVGNPEPININKKKALEYYHILTRPDVVQLDRLNFQKSFILFTIKKAQKQKTIFKNSLSKIFFLKNINPLVTNLDIQIQELSKKIK